MGPTSPLPFRRMLSVFRVPLSSLYFPVRDTGLRCGDFFRYADLQGGIQVPGADSLRLSAPQPVNGPARAR